MDPELYELTTSKLEISTSSLKVTDVFGKTHVHSREDKHIYQVKLKSLYPNLILCLNKVAQMGKHKLAVFQYIVLKFILHLV